MCGMKRLFLAVLFYLAPLLGHAQEETEDENTISKQEWDAWKEQIRGFDEIRMTEPMAMTEVPVQWTPKGLEYKQKPVPNRLLYIGRGISDADTFLSVLDYQEKHWLGRHACLGLFHLTFFRKGERVGFMYYAHGIYWAPLTLDSQKSLNRWLRDHGFPIAEVLSWRRAEPRVRF